jgi:hypothetical protein
MKIIEYFIIVILLSGCVSVNIGVEQVSSKQKGTFILAQIDSISPNGTKIFFTPIQPYTTLAFKALEIDGNEALNKSDFYNSLVLNNFREGAIEITPAQLKKVKRYELYLLVIDILKSNREKLVIEGIIRPNVIKFSTLVKLK